MGWLLDSEVLDIFLCHIVAHSIMLDSFEKYSIFYVRDTFSIFKTIRRRGRRQSC
jgi:hypothetical protein